MLNKELLFELIKTPSPSGEEVNIQKKIINLMAPYSDQVITHHNYNLINAININSPVKVLLCGHIDEIGLCINEIKANGTCSLSRVGSIRPYMYAGQHVRVITKDHHEVPGVIGYVPNMGKGNLEVSNLILDLGTSSKAETLKLVEIGDPVIHMVDYCELNNNKLAGRALDDKLGAFICLEVLKKIKASDCKNGVYVSTTVGEETTGRGAKAASDVVNPTIAIAIDVTYATDINYREDLSGNVSLGKGICTTKGSIMNPIIHELMLSSIKRLNINYQPEIATSLTWTDADDMYYKHQGIPTYLISIPLRYMHSSVEVCDYQDIEDVIELLYDFITHIDENTNFNPFSTNATIVKEQGIAIKYAQIQDVPQLCTWWANGQIMEHAGFPKGIETDREKLINSINKADYDNYALLVIEVINDKIIGEMNYRLIDSSTRTFEIGIKICEEKYQNYGIGTLALQLLINHLFKKLDAKKIVLDTMIENTRAQHVYEKLGFIKTDVKENYYVDQLDQPRTVVFYELERK